MLVSFFITLALMIAGVFFYHLMSWIFENDYEAQFALCISFILIFIIIHGGRTANFEAMAEQSVPPMTNQEFQEAVDCLAELEE